MNNCNTKKSWIAAIMFSAVVAVNVYHERSKRQSNKRKNNQQQHGNSANNENNNHDDVIELPPHVERAIHKEKRRQESVRFLAMKSPMYDNIEMYDPQGQILCTISHKKARWYLKKKLATWKKQDASIQLLFEPNGKSGKDNKYNTTHKQNICVCCGANEHFMRHYIVPYSYRRLLPTKYKTHMPHDIVILCPDCHLSCEQATQMRQKEMERAIRTDPETEHPNIPSRELHHVRSCALALFRASDKLPQEKRVEYEHVLQSYFQQSLPNNNNNDDDNNNNNELTMDQIKMASAIDTQIPNEKYIPGAELVVQALNNDDANIETFIRNWRKHFLQVVSPQHLPTGWSVDSPVHCDLREQ